jgi:hypothetical protein
MEIYWIIIIKDILANLVHKKIQTDKAKINSFQINKNNRIKQINTTSSVEDIIELLIIQIEI